MPRTEYDCPDCGATMASDELKSGFCLTPGCGHEFDADWYDEQIREHDFPVLLVPDRILMQIHERPDEPCDC